MTSQPETHSPAGASLQSLCETGQERLMRMEYLQAEAALAEAERLAWAARDWDTLSRLYMPLQEARRQRRQRCGEGTVCLDLLADGPADRLDARHVVENYPHGQLLLAGWGSLAPAEALRQLQAKHELFVETFLAAVYPVGPTGAGGATRAVVIVALPEVRLPDPEVRTVEELKDLLPPHSLILVEDELPRGSRRGSPQTYGEVMALWERLHAPFLAAADAQVDPARRMEGYRTALRVDYACELAHQKLSDAARRLMRRENVTT